MPQHLMVNYTLKVVSVSDGNSRTGVLLGGHLQPPWIQILCPMQLMKTKKKTKKKRKQTHSKSQLSISASPSLGQQ